MLHFAAISRQSDIRNAVSHAAGNTVWLAENRKSLWSLTREALGLHPSGRTSLGTLIALTEPKPSSLPTLSSIFARVILGHDHGRYHFLPRAELLEVLGVAHPDEYFIAWAYDDESHVVNLLRGDFTSLAIPESWFTPSPTGEHPDFSDISIVDYGQALKLGAYEASGDAILYEFDARYRSRLRQYLEMHEQGFGPSLRRLRKQKGLRLSDFSPLSEKQMRRIEKGEVKRLHLKTREILSETLGVPFDEIETY